jgi:bifunctional non-homologous end joining protein LigD
VIDGVAIVVAEEDGLSDFFLLHAALSKGYAPDAFLIAFDIRHLDGEDHRGRVLEGRLAVLGEILGQVRTRRGEPRGVELWQEIGGNGPRV